MKKKIVVSGSGIGGLCAALALTHFGFNVVVYEQSPQLGEVGAGLQLSPNAMHVLQFFGLAEEISARAFQPSHATMRHYKTGKTYFAVPLAKQMRQKYGAEYLHIHRADLHSILYEACLKLKVSIHLGAAISHYKQHDDQVEVFFNKTPSVFADALVGADGIKSKVQACMLGQQPAQFTGQVAWRGIVRKDQLPAGLVKPNANLWVGPEQHFVSYYLRGGELINFVAVQERSDWQSESWHEKGDVQALQQAFSAWHPEVSEVLMATQECFLWALFDRQPLNQWVDNKVALLGDACHPMLPFLAQGAAMAIEDSFVLAQSLAQHQHTNVALKAYQHSRLSRTSDIQGRARNNAGLYHMTSAVERAKLQVLLGLSSVGMSNRLAARQLDSIYSHNVTQQ